MYISRAKGLKKSVCYVKSCDRGEMRIFNVTATDLTHKISTAENIRALGLKVLLRSPRLHHACIIKSTRNMVCSLRSHTPYVTKCSDFNDLLTVHIDTIKVLFVSLMHNLFIKSIAFLYMFRALFCSSSGGLKCIYASSGSWYHHSP
jgi:hypothetical protein